MHKIRLLAAALTLAGIGTSNASEFVNSESKFQLESQYELITYFGGGFIVYPAHGGSDDYLIGFVPFFSPVYLKIPVFPDIGSPDGKSVRLGKPGFSFNPTVRIIPGRKSNAHKSFANTHGVHRAYEIGIGGKYRQGALQGYIDSRLGFGGYSGFTGAFGISAIFNPTENWNVIVGPRVDFASSGFINTYFGETANQTAPELDGGVYRYGIMANSAYDVTNDIRLHWRFTYNRLAFDAADSKIARSGSANQFTLASGISYRISLDIWD